MKNKRFYFLLCCGILLLYPSLSATLFAQMADGSPPANTTAGTKYIFYWGKMQCDLTEANNYHGTYRCTPTAFRQVLLNSPQLWTGAQMAERISFQLEGLPVVSTRGAFDYTALIGTLDEALGQKVVAQQVLHLTKLQLDEHRTGQIDLYIDAPETADAPAYIRMSPLGASNLLNTRFVQQVIWGREDIYDNANRDFFSITEFWRTVQQLPVVEWAPSSQPQAIGVDIQLKDIDGAAFSFRATLEAPAYRQMVEQLDHYRHLLRPGSEVTLALHSAEQYEYLFEKKMYIVAENDPRLSLRRNRDTHSFRMNLGNWEENLNNLYLLEMTDPLGKTNTVDPPISILGMIRKEDLVDLQAAPAVFWKDGQEVPDLSYQFHTPTQTVRLQAGQSVPDSLLVVPDSTLQEVYQLSIDSFAASGYSFPAMSFKIRIFSPAENLRVCNQLSTLLAAPESILVKLHAPTPVDSGYSIDLEIPKAADARLSIFMPDGENIFNVENRYPIGRHTVEIPRIVFRQPGKYYLFLNTDFGVAKQELVLE